MYNTRVTLRSRNKPQKVLHTEGHYAVEIRMVCLLYLSSLANFRYFRYTDELDLHLW
jgi:hypothetical protein